MSNPTQDQCSTHSDSNFALLSYVDEQGHSWYLFKYPSGEITHEFDSLVGGWLQIESAIQTYPGVEWLEQALRFFIGDLGLPEISPARWISSCTEGECTTYRLVQTAGYHSAAEVRSEKGAAMLLDAAIAAGDVDPTDRERLLSQFHAFGAPASSEEDDATCYTSVTVSLRALAAAVIRGLRRAELRHRKFSSLTIIVVDEM